ncbi:MAG: ATP-binding cassette domain-containing protein [Anaerolineae bacterium]|nr:ATP-binding cassette domain-containing protein [Anaerolineae bacterium]
MAEIIVNLDHVSVSLAARPIFGDLAWEIQRDQRIGLVGPNGTGKSTLMKLIAQEVKEDSGTIFRLSGLTIGRLEQEPELPPGRTVLQESLSALPELGDIERELESVADRMSKPEVYGNEKALEKAIRVQERLLHQFEQLGGARYESTVKETLTSLGMTSEIWATKTEHLSGGQKKLVMLAKLLVQQPSLLLLDEPDNHLDLHSKRALEKIIRDYPGCVIIISHDRYLLDEVATHIAELAYGRLTQYTGNYTAYATERAIRRLRQQQLYAAQQKEIARIEAAIARFELWASLVVNERHIRQARSRQKMLDKMDKIEKVTDAKRMTLDLNGWRGSNKVLDLVNVGLRFENGKTLFSSLNLTIWHGERVGLVGPNGAGKSALLKLLLDPDSATSGEIKRGPSIQIGYYSQEQETLDPAQDLISCIRQAAPLTQEAAVAFLLKFLFTYDQVQQPIGKLSGGERSRLQLARLVLQRPNLLLLDEPTNNLDIPAIEVLEETLNEFVGTALIISHDRYFLDKTVDRIIELRNGRLTEFLGGYTDYLTERGYDE